MSVSDTQVDNTTWSLSVLGLNLEGNSKSMMMVVLIASFAYPVTW